MGAITDLRSSLDAVERLACQFVSNSGDGSLVLWIERDVP